MYHTARAAEGRRALLQPQVGAGRYSSGMDASAFIPAGRLTLAKLSAAARGCKGCELHQSGRPAVFGEGPASARVMLVGEQPGDVEDRAERPFVGPAGKLLDLAMGRAGLDRSSCYLTNAVKHFRFVVRGARRLHNSPKIIHIRSCRPWLESEVAVVKPEVLLCLGAVATKAILGPTARVTRDRGRVFAESPLAPAVIVTEHPSAILRGDPEEREVRLAALVKDLRVAVKLIS